MSTCPKISFQRQRIVGSFIGLRIAAYDADKNEVGSIFARVENNRDPFVSWVEVDDSRCRLKIATKLYEQLAKDICDEFKVPLSSDVERAFATQRLWEKQVAKGRAYCVAPTERNDHPDPKQAVRGRGGCLAYQLNSCDVVDLSGTKRKQRRKKRR